MSVSSAAFMDMSEIASIIMLRQLMAAYMKLMTASAVRPPGLLSWLMSV